jgi:hypothetical protein
LRKWELIKNRLCKNRSGLLISELTGNLRLFVNEGDAAGLEALLALGDFEFYAVTFVQATEAGALNFGIVDKEIVPIFAGDESIALVTIKPLDCASDTFVHCCNS